MHMHAYGVMLQVFHSRQSTAQYGIRCEILHAAMQPLASVTYTHTHMYNAHMHICTSVQYSTYMHAILAQTCMYVQYRY